MNPMELDLVLTFIQTHPRAAAREFELQSLDTAVELLNTMPLSHGRELFLHALPSYIARLCSLMPSERVVELMDDDHINHVCSILRCLPKSQRVALLKALPEKTRTLCRLLLSYAEDTVGAWMKTDYLVLPEDCLAADAVKRLSMHTCFTDANAIAVVDLKQHLLGLIDIKTLLKAKEKTEILHLMKEHPPTLSSRASLNTTARHTGWRSSDSLAVLDRNKRLVGFLRHLDLRNGLERFGEKDDSTHTNDFIGNIGDAYVGSMSALLSLLGTQST